MVNGKFYEAPFGKYPMEGRTGRGDTVTVAYVALTRTTTHGSALTRYVFVPSSRVLSLMLMPLSELLILPHQRCNIQDLTVVLRHQQSCSRLRRIEV